MPPARVSVLNLRTATSQKCEALPRRARIEGSQTCVSADSRLESNKEENFSFCDVGRGLRLWGLGLGSGLRFEGSGFRVQVLGFKV